MSTYILIIAVLAGVLAASATQPSCPEGGCKNFTIYLGPRWRSRMVKFPNYPKLKGPSKEELSKMSTEYTRKTTTERNDFGEGSGDYYSHNIQPQNLIAKHRPIPVGSSIGIDYSDVVRSHAFSNHPYRVIPRGTGRPHGEDTTGDPVDTVENNALTVDMNELYEIGVVNLTGIGITGEEVKECLSQLSNLLNGDANMQLKRLYLSHNQIQNLPLLVFPVDLEYWLQELRLDNNPFYYITSYTRFELSRLGNLKILSLAQTGIRYLDSLYIPSLEVLDLSGNRLTSIPQSLENLHNLQELYLDDNKIFTLYGDPLSSMRDLRVLSLARNHISQIWDRPFMSLNYLHKLYLNNNSLESLAEVDVHSMTTLHVGGNPLICSCPLLKQLDQIWLDIADRANVTCYSVASNRLRLVSSLQEHDQLVDCPSKMETIVTHVKDAVRWLLVHNALAKLFNLLLWLLVVVVLVLAMHHRFKKARRKTASLEVPYNILDDKILT